MATNVCSRRTWSLKGFGQCGDDGLDLGKRMSDFDEYSCFKGEPTLGDEEVPAVGEERGCLPRLFKLKKVPDVPDNDVESPPMARSGRAPGQDIFDYTSKIDDQGSHLFVNGILFIT